MAEIIGFADKSSPFSHAPASPRACRPGGAWPGGRAGLLGHGPGLSEGQLARKGALGLGGCLLRMRVMGGRI